MQIRQAQLEALADERELVFVRRMVRHISEDLADRFGILPAQSENLAAFVVEQLALARRYGLVKARDLKTYIDCGVIFGGRFDVDPQQWWANAVLANPHLSGSEKADVLHDHLTFSGEWPPVV